MARSTSWGAGAVPAEAATAIVARARCWASEPSRRARRADALAQPPRQRGRGRGRRVAQPDRGAPVEVARQPPQRAEEQPQRAALLGVREHDLGRPVAASSGRPTRSAPGRIRCSRRGSSARPGRAWRRSSPCGRRAGRTGAPPPCAPPGSRRAARWWSGSVPTFSAREWRSAAEAALGANGSCTWTKSSSARVEQLLERARHVERQRHRAAAPERQRLADGEHRRAARVGRERVRVGAHRLDGRAPVADQLARVRRRDHHHAVAARCTARPTAARRSG